MEATNIDNKGKIKKNKDILSGNCIFPFKYRGKTYDECVEGNTGNWCATSLTKRGAAKTWGYCIDKILKKKTSKQSLSKKSSSKKSVKKPRGRPPFGKRWDEKKGKWVNMCWGCLTDQPNQLAHMDPGGCLCQESDFSDISSSKSSSRKLSSRKSTSKLSSTKISSKKSASSSIGEILTFGKHSGKTFEWVYDNDTQYCDWVIEQGSNTSEFSKFKAYCDERKKINHKNNSINELIISELTLLKQKETVSKNWFKVRAYNTAIKAVKDDFKDSPIKSGSELKKYKGIGDKIVQKIDEIISEGHLKSADKIRGDEDIQIINNFKDGIYGIGISKATELVKDLNIKNIEELIKRQKEIMSNGRELLNNVQKKGLKHYEDSLLKIPRSEMIQHDKYLNDIAKELDNVTVTVAGSYRRELPSSGDIDVLIKEDNNNPETLHLFVKKLKESGYIIEDYVYGDKKFQGMCQLDGDKHARRLDLLLTTVEEYPFALFYFTGSGTFNPKIRQIVMDQGYRLSEQGIYEIDEKKKIKNQIYNNKQGLPFRTEEDIFNFIGIPYIQPKNRNPDTLDKSIIE